MENYMARGYLACFSFSWSYRGSKLLCRFFSLWESKRVLNDMGIRQNRKVNALGSQNIRRHLLCCVLTYCGQFRAEWSPCREVSSQRPWYSVRVQSTLQKNKGVLWREKNKTKPMLLETETYIPWMANMSHDLLSIQGLSLFLVFLPFLMFPVHLSS